MKSLNILKILGTRNRKERSREKQSVVRAKTEKNDKKEKESIRRGEN